MYCVIQEIYKARIPKGEAKKIEVSTTTYISNNGTVTTYGYHMSSEHCERNVCKAYRISIHKSFRKDGKVCKEQAVICTIGYYDIVDLGTWVGDYAFGWEAKVKSIGLPEDELVEMIYGKFQPVIDRVRSEYKDTEEYRLREEHEKILGKYREEKDKFANKYQVESGEYDRCYDVFGTLRSSEYLKKVQAEYKFRKEHEKNSQKWERSYYDNFRSNYSQKDDNSQSGGNKENFNRELYKKFYRTLSKTYHPDSNPDKDTSEEMKLLNQLKQQWNV